MEIIETLLPEVKCIRMPKHGDARGFFAETYKQNALADAGITTVFVQDNQSYSAAPYTLRGLHYQTPPFAQAKLVRVLKGAVLDVVVDIRKGSPRFGQSVLVTLSADNFMQLFVPEGFAHGVLSLTPDTELFYKVSAPYAPAHDRGMRWNDPKLGIAWPANPDNFILSDRDRALPFLDEADNPFTYPYG